MPSTSGLYTRRGTGLGRGSALALGFTLTLHALSAAAQVPAPLELRAIGRIDEDVDVDGAEHAAPESDGPESDASAAPDSAAREADPRREAERLRMHNTWLGPGGGLRVVDAGVGQVGTFRLQLGIDIFGSADYLLLGDEVDGSGGTLSLSWAVLEYLELSLSVAAHSYYDSFGRTELLQSMGDTQLAAKLGFAVLPWLSVGADVRLVLPAAVGDVGLGFNGTGVGLRGNVSADLRQFGSGVPVIGRFGLGYYFDQSANLIEDVEDARYAALDDPLALDDEDRHLVTRYERLAFGINRMDSLGLELGLEVPLRMAERWFVHPLLEWRLGVPVNRQGYSCLSVPTDADNSGPDGCLDQQGLRAMPMTLTLGARLYPWLRGLALTLGVDIGLTGARTFVRELAPNRPWSFLVALGYAVDPRPVVVQAAPSAVPAPVPAAVRRARLEGLVTEAGSEEPVAEARIDYPGHAHTTQIADAEGKFVSYLFAPGQVRLLISHPQYEPAECMGIVGEHGLGPGDDNRVSVRCELPARPRLGSLTGQVRSRAGAVVAGADVALSGPAEVRAQSDASGGVALQDLPPGAYQVEVRAPGHLSARSSLLVPAGQTLTPEFVLDPVPPKSDLVRITKRAVVIRRNVHFRLNSGDLEEDSYALLDEVAAAIQQNPEISRVEVQGHTDNRGSASTNRALSQARADTVRDYLVRAGVAAERLTARGYGDTRPLVPNLTDKNRARNRRVAFVILARDK